MLKKTVLLCTFFWMCVAHAENVVLMIGDGMGKNHVSCASKDMGLFLNETPVRSAITTHSANNAVTDSAASATVYACGIKTNNGFLGVDTHQKSCQTIAETALEHGMFVGILSTDMMTGATPSAFYAHVTDRYMADTIKTHLQKARSAGMDIRLAVPTLSDEVDRLLTKAEQSGQPFFLMIEGARIDTRSHENKFDLMAFELRDFDQAVKTVVDRLKTHPDTTVIVTADHETGGLNDHCVFTTRHHTSSNVNVWAFGGQADLLNTVRDNTDIYRMIHHILIGKQ